MVVKLDIKPNKIDVSVEKKIVSVIEKCTKNSRYLLLDTCDVEVLKKKIDIPNLTDEMILSVRHQYLKHKTIVRHNILVNSIDTVYDAYKRSRDIITVSNRYDFPPVNIFRQIFRMKKYSEDKIKAVLKNPSLLKNKRDEEQLQTALQLDIVSSSDQTKSLLLSQQYEKCVEDMLIKNKINYKTQEQLTEEQIKKYGKPVNTPDFLLLDDVVINGKPVKWIDAKNFYGSTYPVMKKKIDKQVQKYISKWGCGAIIFNRGFSSRLKIHNVLLL